MIKKFSEMIDEASLQGNPGIPGQGGEGDDYLGKVDARAQQKIAELERRYGREIGNFMGLVQRARQIQAGKEKELEKLAEDAIRAFYGSILEGVNLNIKFPKPGGIQDMMQDVQEESDEEKFKELTDTNVISMIQMRKIANNITQGEAKNSKLCLNLQEVTDGFTRIFGQQVGNEYRELLNKITDIAGIFDWKIPMDVQLEMWTRDKSGFAGSVKVEWDTPEDEEETEDLAKKILDDLESSDEIPEEEAEELFAQTGPTIHALGTDFAMLLHETVKGIYELIAACAIPQDEETAETVIMNTDSLADELEDLRYGPEIAADLRDFVNQFHEVEDIPNLRERVFGKMMLMPAEDFLKLMFMILNEEDGAKKIVKEMIDQIGDEINQYNLGQA
jgi:hypothetical protein